MNHKTIKDVAQAAGVSYSTVSRALNRRPGVNEETRRRVLQAAEALGYRPHGPARSLINRKTQIIGLLIPDITNPFFPELARAIEEQAQDCGYSLMLCNTGWNSRKELDFLTLLTERRVDGLIIAPSGYPPDELDAHVVDSGLPVVYVSHAPPMTVQPYVVIDDVWGGMLATEHLIAQGIRTIGFIGSSDESISVQKRLSGFHKACARHGIPEEQRTVILESFRHLSSADVLKRLVAERSCPQALFIENDVLALDIVEEARAMGLRIPKDLAVVGFDDIPVARMRHLSLSTVAQPKREMGHIAFDLLRDEIERIHAAPRKTRSPSGKPTRGVKEGTQSAMSASGGSDKASDKAVNDAETIAPEQSESAGSWPDDARPRQIVLQPTLVPRRTSVRLCNET